MPEGTFENQTVIVQDPSALEAVSRAETDIQIATAHKYPRSVTRSLDQAKALATLSPEIAASMTYYLPRGAGITGPSVRLAEVLAPSWGNIHAGSRIIEIGKTHVVAQGLCHDLETNYRYQHEVRRRITDKEGKRFKDDMIVVTCNAACSVAFREAVFHTIPRSFVNQIWADAQQTASGAEKGFAARRDNAVAWVYSQGVDEVRLLSFVGKASIDQLTPGDVQKLHGVYQAVTSGEANVEEAFPTPVFADGIGTPKQPAPSMGAKPEDGKPPQEDEEAHQPMNGAEAGQEAGSAGNGQGAPPGPPAEEGPVRRRATHEQGHPDLNDGQPFKSCGISGAQIVGIKNATLEEGDLRQVIESMYENLNLHPSCRRLRYLKESEGEKILNVIGSLVAATKDEQAQEKEEPPQMTDQATDASQPGPVTDETTYTTEPTDDGGEPGLFD